MTTRELLENANLAALGLLDADEHAAYEGALSKSPVAVREHILKEQARWSGGDGLLPSVDAPEHLRERVLDAVRGAMVDDEIAQSAASFDTTFGKQHRVSALWRAGALGLLCACVALTGMLVYVRQTERESADRLASGLATEGLRGAMGYKFVDDVVFDASTQRIAFEASDSAFEGTCTLYLNDKWGEGRAVMSAMPVLNAGERYAIVELTAEGKVARELASFTGSVQMDSVGVKLVERGTKIALVVTSANRASGDRVLMTASIV
jgi:hypothetical protein